MKVGCLTALGVLLLTVAALVIGWKIFYPSYSYRYRLTVNIEVDGKLHSGSSVIEVTWFQGPKIGEGTGWGSEIRGQAVLVDLEARGAVVATVVANDSDAGWSMRWIVPRAFGVNETDYPLLPQLRGKRELSPNNMPRFLWFADPQNPRTAQVLFAKDIGALLGPSARFAGASVEITDDPIVVDIREKLLWLKPLGAEPSGQRVIYLPSGLGISPYMFIGKPDEK